MELSQASLDDIKQELVRRMQEIQAFLPAVAPTQVNNHWPDVPALPGRSLGRNLKESVLLYVQSFPGRNLRRSQVKVRGYDYKSIGASLSTLARAGQIKRVSRGVYTAR